MSMKYDRVIVFAACLLWPCGFAEGTALRAPAPATFDSRQAARVTPSGDDLPLVQRLGRMRKTDALADDHLLSKLRTDKPHQNFQWSTWLMLETNGTDQYADIFKCWAKRYLRSLSAHRNRTMRITCLSEPACDVVSGWRRHHTEAGKLESVSLTVHRRFEPKQAARKFERTPGDFYKRIYFDEILSLMEESTKGVLHTDLDAFWMGDVETTMKMVEVNFPKADLVYSMGDTVPPPVHKDWGFTLCNGFALYRNTVPMRRFIKRIRPDYAARTLIENDQEFINLALWRQNCTWRNVTRGDIATQPIKYGKCSDLRVVVLPEELVGRDRTRESNDTRVVVHPYIRDDWKMELFRNMSICS